MGFSFSFLPHPVYSQGTDKKGPVHCSVPCKKTPESFQMIHREGVTYHLEHKTLGCRWQNSEIERIPLLQAQGQTPGMGKAMVIKLTWDQTRNLAETCPGRQLDRSQP